MPTVDIEELTDECVLWPGKLTEGYGNVKRDGKTLKAHRAVWIDTHGPIPDGLVVDHICRNRACININHLRLLTREENLRIGVVHNRTKTCCPEGHPYDKVDNRGRRSCSTCIRRKEREGYHRRKNHA
jgi:hypothetical protein